MYAQKKKKKGTHEVISNLVAENEDNFVPCFLSLGSQPQEMSQVNLKVIYWQWISSRILKT